MTTWREEFDKEFLFQGFNEGFYIRGNNPVKEIKTFISLTLQSAFDEVENGLPIKGITDLYLNREFYPEEFIGHNQAGGYNVCLKDVRKHLKNIKEKFL